MGRLILPGRHQRPGGLTIFVPGSAADKHEPRFVCRVPQGDGQVCGQTFETELAWESHMRGCVQRTGEDRMLRDSPRTRMPVFREEEWDPEWAAHQRRIGERMLREGRLVQRRNER